MELRQTTVIGIAIGLVVAAIIIVICVSARKEGFISTPYGAATTAQGAITGPVIYTNSLMKGDPKSLLESVDKDGTVRDESCIILGASNNKNEINEALKSQIKVMDIQNKSHNGFQKIEDLKEISKEIAQHNSIKGMFKRDSGAQTKLVIDKYATVGIIDEKYMPNRDRPKELRAVGTAIVMPGFAFDATKALDSHGTGICPIGGVGGVGIERNRKKVTGLNTLGQVQATPAEDTTLKSNGISTATTVV